MFEGLRRSLKIPVKLALLVALLLIPVALLLVQFTRVSNEAIAFANQELRGVEYLAAVQPLYENVAQHRDLAVLFLSGEAARGASVQAKQGEVQSDFQALAEVDRRLGGSLKTSKPLATLTKGWQVLRDQVRDRGLDAPGAFAEHTRLLAEIEELIRLVGDNSKLILDPDLDSYYLMDATVLRLPQVAESLGQLRGLGAGVARRGQITLLERSELAQRSQAVRDDLEAMSRGFRVVGGANPAVGARIDPQLKEMSSGVDAFLGLVERQMINAPDAIRVTPENHLAAATTALDRVFKMYDRSLASLQDLVNARIGRQRTARNNRLLLAGGLILAGLVGTGLIIRGINRQVKAIGEVLGEVGIGNIDARARVHSTDELGLTAQYLNSMLDNLRGLMQSQEERDQIQDSIMKLLNEVSSVAEGDLRASAEVGPDAIGAIADSFNFMIGELRQVIEAVKETTTRVSASAGEVQTTAEKLAQGSAGQASQIQQTSTLMEQMTASIQQVSENAAAAVKVAEQALDKARQGADSVNRTIEGMNAIRGQVQETSKRIKRLGESSQEIGEIVQVIGDIADRTSILALNASIQAAAAGDAGRGFMVVAEEVERLAQRAATSSKSIETLVKTIQGETYEAVAAMEGTTREVVGGSNLALGAGKSLGEIEEVSSRLAGLIQSISSVTSSHARGTQDVARTMGRLSELTTRTAATTRETALSIRGLAGLADQLRESMDRFKVPEKAS